VIAFATSTMGRGSSLVALACALTAGPAMAQQLPVNLADGATWTFTAKHDREVSGQPSRSFSVTTSKRLTWRKGADGVDGLRMEHVSVVANSGIPPEAAFTQTLTIPVEFEVDGSLTPTAMANLDEVREATRQMIIQARGGENSGAGVISPELLDQTASALVGRELGVLSRGQGTNFKLATPVVTDTQVANPLGGPAIQGKSSFTLESYDPAARRAVVMWRQALDPRSMKDSMSAAAAALAKAPPERKEEAKAAFAKLDMKRDEMCRYEIDIPTGLATQVECSLKADVVDGEKTLRTTDNWTITQTLPGNPR